MKRFRVASFPVLAAVLVALSGVAMAETKTLTVPKGTKVEKLGPGHFKLHGPEGCVFEIKAYQKLGKGQGKFGEVGIIGDCGIFDKSGKIIATGAKGVLKSGAGAIIGDSGKALKDIPPADYIKIDDEVTWLPATIEFTPVRVFNRPALNKLSPQPDPPGVKR